MKSHLGRAVVVLGVLFILVACGDGDNSSILPSYSLSSSSTLSDALEAFDQVVPMLDAGLENECEPIEPQVSWSCACPGGGMVEVTATENMDAFTLMFNDCTSMNGQVFNGTMSGIEEETADSEGFDEHQENLVITYDLAEFGNCSDAFGTVIVRFDNAEGTDECFGAVNATCGGETASCELSTGCNSCI